LSLAARSLVAEPVDWLPGMRQPYLACLSAARAAHRTGAPAEHDFIRKLDRAGFLGVEVQGREPLSIDDCALDPLLSDQVIRPMCQLIPCAKQGAVAVSVVVRGSLPASEPHRTEPQ
jgi:hypothetical protein